jgi:flagellar basal-body rod modification protein FlgD
MEISVLEPLTAATPTSKSIKSLSDDFDNFLTMLTVQLQNQDPLSPLDSTEFTNQLVQFSQLEQQISQADKIDDLIALQKSSESAAALGYLGNEVEIASSVAMLAEGEGKFAYHMPSEASSLTISIYDSEGHLVRNMTGDTEAGRHDVVWDGKDNQNLTVADGAYSISVSATDANDDPINNIDIYSRGVAEEVITDSGLTYLRVGKVYVPLDRIVAVGPAPVTAS